MKRALLALRCWWPAPFVASSPAPAGFGDAGADARGADLGPDGPANPFPCRRHLVLRRRRVIRRAAPPTTSTICFDLGITEVNQTTTKLLFARFTRQTATNLPTSMSISSTSAARKSFSTFYQRYGRDRPPFAQRSCITALARAIREVGKAHGLTPDVTATLAKTVGGYGDDLPDDHVRQAGLDPTIRRSSKPSRWRTRLIGFPRHLSQHVGGFILTRRTARRNSAGGQCRHG